MHFQSTFSDPLQVRHDTNFVLPDGLPIIMLWASITQTSGTQCKEPITSKDSTLVLSMNQMQ